ncbi:class I SAM-dependent methyltransferase [Candidatus Woesearchaeota archaeon]|nr:MAG: class I SAM-dependent methyltransferase [Candidatus Woesearchaeota archaeon]
MKDQQKQTQDFFHRYAADWLKKASTDEYTNVNVIQQRNDYVLDVIKERKKTVQTLDVGCGTGELVCAIAKSNIQAIGIDFAADMIALAKKNAEKARLTKATFSCTDFFSLQKEGNTYDVISANGFIEYISPEQLTEFMKKSRELLNEHGSLVFGSRNRLFNLFSLNSFTENERAEKTVDALLEESLALAKNADINNLQKLPSASLPATTKKQAKTGIDVEIRYQYTPAQLIKKLKENGFDIKNVSPIHIHGMIPEVKENHPKIHGTIANMLQSIANNNRRLIPYASSFMTHAVRR